MPSAVCVNAPAKINLFLNLLGLRPDGFHEVRFVMQMLDLTDTLEITPIGEGVQLNLRCRLPALATPDNLITKAYHRFYAESGLIPIALDVNLIKRIPVEAGLGGGSSDGAAMLKVLNQLHGAPLSKTELHAIAAQLGSDVPFFLEGGTCLATGRGEQIKPLPPLPPVEVVLIKPKGFGISTAKAYQWVRETGHYVTRDISPWEELLKQPCPSVFALGQLLHNDFEAVLFPHYPVLAETKEALLALGLPGVLLSGSGPTIFGLLNDPEPQWRQIQNLLPEEDWFLYRSRFQTGDIF